MIFKERKQVDSWQCSTMALACAQDVAEVLEPGHVPVPQDDKDLFWEKEKFMFAVLDQTLLTLARLLSMNMRMTLSLMLRRYMQKLSSSTSSQPRPLWTLLTYCPISPLPVLALAYGRVPPTVSFSTGKTRSAYMKSKFLQQTTSLMAKSK